MNVANLLLRITGNNQDAKRALREVAEEIRRVSSEEARANVKIAGAEEAKAKLRELETALTLVGQRNVTAKVKVKIDKSRNELQQLGRELEHALAGGAGARPLEHIFSDISRVGNDVEQLGTKLGGIGERVSSFFSAVGTGVTDLTSKIGSGLVQAIGGMVAQGLAWVALFILLLPLITALVAILAALISSLGAAIAGAAALAVALGGVLLPVLGVLILAFTTIAKAIQAVNKEKQQAAARARQLATDERNLANAQRTAAQDRKNVQQQLLDAYKAQRDAVDQLHSAELQREESVLGIADANLALERAKLNLKNLKDEAQQAGPAIADLFQKLQDVDFRPSAALAGRIAGVRATDSTQLDVKQAMLDLLHAQLGVKQAKEANIEATHHLADAQANENKFVREGVKAYQPYADALRQSAAANRAVAAAEQKVEYDRKHAHDAIKGFSQDELSLGHALIDMWHEIQKIFKPVLAPIFDGIKTFLEDLKKFLMDASVKAGFQDIGDAVGYVFVQFGKLLQRRDVRKMFADLAHDGAQLVRILGGRVFTDLALILIRIAHVAAPELIALFRRFADWLDKLAEGTSHTHALRRGVNSVIDSFKDWLGLAHAVARLIINFFGAGKKQGDSLVKTITHQVNQWADLFAQKGEREKITNWIKHAIETVSKWWSGLKDVVGVFKTIVDWVHHLINVVKASITGWEKIVALIKEALYLAGLYHPDTTGGVTTDKSISKQEAGLIKDKSLTPAQRNDILRNLAADYVQRYGLRGFVMFNDWRRQHGFAWGGMVPGWGGFGDDQLHALEGGEYVVRRSVVSSIGRSALDAINAGFSLPRVAAMAGGGGGGYNIDKIILPPAPAAAIPDARYQAVQLGRELSRRGGSG